MSSQAQQYLLEQRRPPQGLTANIVWTRPHSPASVGTQGFKAGKFIN